MKTIEVFALTLLLYFLLSKIVWPEHWDSGADDVPYFILTVDGVHCQIEEPKHPTLSKNPAFWSHKYNAAGLGYEIGIAIFEKKVVWLKGPFRAGKPDISVFKNGEDDEDEDEVGLYDKIPPGHKGIADKGYPGCWDKLSKSNSHDSDAVRKLKGRARAHHETFNGGLKNFNCLSQKFRHKDIDKHRLCFHAVSVICIYQLENGSPLFDV